MHGADLPEPPFENASYVFLIGRAFYELGESEKAAAVTSRRRFAAT